MYISTSQSEHQTSEQIGDAPGHFAISDSGREVGITKVLCRREVPAFPLERLALDNRVRTAQADSCFLGEKPSKTII